MANKEYTAMIDPANYRRSFRKDFSFRQGLVVALAIHAGMMLFFVMTPLESKPVEERRVTLKLDKSHAPKKIVQARQQEQRRQQAQQQRTADKPVQNNTAPADSRNNGAVNQNPFSFDDNKQGGDTKPDNSKPLFKDDKLDGGNNDNRLAGQAGHDQTNRTSGTAGTMSRGAQSSTGTPGGTPGDPFASQGGTTASMPSNPFGGGATAGSTGPPLTPSSGVASLGGRSTVGRPYIEIPDAYKKQGLSYTVRVVIRVNAEGVVLSAEAVTGGIDPKLQRILTAYARRYRFQAKPGAPLQSGTVVFTIRPRR